MDHARDDVLLLFRHFCFIDVFSLRETHSLTLTWYATFRIAKTTTLTNTTATTHVLNCCKTHHINVSPWRHHPCSCHPEGSDAATQGLHSGISLRLSFAQGSIKQFQKYLLVLTGAVMDENPVDTSSKPWCGFVHFHTQCSTHPTDLGMGSNLCIPMVAARPDRPRPSLRSNINSHIKGVPKGVADTSKTREGAGGYCAPPDSTRLALPW
eukprot:362082-Chlamydomonas_euryale.AAC.1